MTTTAKPQLDRYQQRRLDQARKALEASANETDYQNYPKHLGSLEVITRDLLEIIGSLTGNPG